MDFIIQLPPSKDTVTGVIYDSILVVVNRLTKHAQFIPRRENKSAGKLAKTMLKRDCQQPQDTTEHHIRQR